MIDDDRLVRAEALPYRLPLARPWISSHGRTLERRGWLIRLVTADGRVGWGDCAPLVEVGTETHAHAGRYLRNVLPVLTGEDPEPSAPPASACALDTALCDLAAQAEGLPLHRWLDPGGNGRVDVNAAVGALDADVQRRIDEALAAGYRLVKIKLGVRPWRDELDTLRRIAAGNGGRLRLRLDANQAWTLPVARAMIHYLNDLPVESLEEPLRQFDPVALRQLQALSTFPLALDESVRLLGTLPVPVERLVLKPMALGGLRNCLRIAGASGAAQCIVTSSLESVVGVTACAHLAAAMGNGLAHGLATSAWLAGDVATTPAIHNGAMCLSDAASGLGLPDIVSAGS